MRPGLAALTLLAAGCAGCHSATVAERVLLITLDTTRADHLGCYGYTSGATHSLDALAGESTVFEHALSPVPVTLAAHASIFTGLYPAQHGVHYNGTFRLDPSYRTMAEILKEAGFATCAVPSSFAVAKRFGLAQGFDEYQDLFADEAGKPLPPDAERKADDVASRGIEWLGRHTSGRSFVWLHFYDPHFKYNPPFPFSVQFHDRPYDGEIAFVDHEVGKLLDRLRADRGAWERTLLIVVGDHGEGLYDHGESAHATLAYQSTLHVPLLIKPPGGRGRSRVAEPVSLVDLLPTVLAYAGLPAQENLPGLSLKSVLEGRTTAPRALFFEALAGALNYGWSSLDGIARGNWKLIAGVDPELYDLAADPSESRNLYAQEHSRAEELQQELDEKLAGWSAGPKTSGGTPQLDAETLERLASLGYVGVRSADTKREGPDPKKLIHLERDMLDAQEAVAREQWSDVLRICDYVLRSDPTNRLGLSFLVRALLETKKPDEARRTAETLAHHYVDFEHGHDLLGQAWRALHRPDRVVETYRNGIQLLPNSSLLHFRLALAYLDAGQGETGCRQATDDLARWPALPEFLLLRARCETRAGRLQDAVTTMRDLRRKGLDPAPFVEKEPDFAALRSLPEYRAMLSEQPPAKKD